MFQPRLQFLESITSENSSFSQSCSSWKALRQKTAPSARASVPGKHYVRKQLLQPELQFLESIKSENS
jgi:hypothetical protein